MHLYSKHRNATVANRTTAGQRKIANETDPILRQLAEIPRNLRRAEPAFRTRVERHRHDTGRYSLRRKARHIRDSGIRSGLLLLPKSRFDIDWCSSSSRTPVSQNDAHRILLPRWALFFGRHHLFKTPNFRAADAWQTGCRAPDRRRPARLCNCCLAATHAN